MVEDKEKGILYCVCDRASEDMCETCSKAKAISPDHTMNYSGWRREGAHTEKGND